MSTHGVRQRVSYSARFGGRPEVLVGLVAVAVLLAATVLAPDRVPLGVVLLGALLGTGSGLLAVGLVLTYRSHRIVNFALGGIGGLGAGLAIGLHLGQGWPWPVAIVAGVATGLGVGALIERTVLRRLDRSPRLVVTVATIGLAQLCAAGQAALPKLLDGPAVVGSFRTPLSEVTLDVDPLLISGNDLALVVVVPFVLGALTWFLLRTDAGIAIRGIAENGDRARLLGIPAHRLSLLVWTIAGGLAALTVNLRSPSEGLNLSVASTGPQVMLTALAAAVVAGLTSLPRAFAAGVALGILDQLVRWNVDKQAVTSVVLLSVLLVGLLLQRRDSGRAAAAASEGTWVTAGAVRDLPARVRALPEVRAARAGVPMLAVAAALLLAVVGSPSQLNLAAVATTYGVVAVSLVVLTGWAGTVSLGQIAILGTGGVVAGDLMVRWNTDFLVAMLAAGVAGAAIALLVAIPALRVDGQLLAVTTLTFAVAVDTLFLNPTNFPWLVPGAFDRPVLFQRWDMRSDRVLYLVGLALVAFAVLVARNLARGRTQRVMNAARDNPKAATATIHLLVYLVPQLQLVATGAGVLVVLLLLPGGMAQAGAALRDRYAAAIARRHGVEWDPDERPGASVFETARDTHPPAGDTALSCRGVVASYGPNQVLFGVDLDVREGELVALLGTNGAGKSTVLRAIAGLLPSHGSIELMGDRIDGTPTERIASAGLAMMPGGRGVFPTLTVTENLRLACWQIRHDPAATGRARTGAYELFPALSRLADTRAGDLSGGEQQMLSLAMAMAVRPRVLCIDELTLGLAPTVVADLVAVVRRINAGGVTVVVVEQSVNVALLLALRAVFLEKGRVRFGGPTAELLDRPDVLRAVFLGEAAALAPRQRTAPLDLDAPPALHACGLTKSFGGRRVVDEVELSVAQGEIVGLIGHNGAGKTTILDLLSGLLPADAGTVHLGAVELGGLAPHNRARAGLGRSFQDARLYPGLTVAQTLAVALDRHLAHRSPLADALWLPAAFDTQDAVERRVAELLLTLGLSRYRDHRTAELSTGTRPIVELGCVLAQAPKVVLLDEPSAGVAQREAEALMPVLRRVQAELGAAMVVVEHDMALLSGLCDRLVALEAGAVIASGTPAEVLAHPRVIGSYLGADQAVIARSGALV